MKNRFIGIMMDNHPGLITGILGIIKSGNSFVPINPALPASRIGYIINDLDIKVLLTDKANFDKARDAAYRHSSVEHLLCLDLLDSENIGRFILPGERAGDRSKALNGGFSPEWQRTCYVIYTSGSTGNPKGVPISHGNLSPLLTWFRDHFQLGEHTRALQNLSYSFDFGVFEILTTILFGGTLYFLDRTDLDGATAYTDFILRHDINTLHTTPTIFGQTVYSGEMIPRVKIIHLGGEALTGKLVNDAAALVSPECMIYNGYGPTETTINTTIFSLKALAAVKFKESEGIPIGRPSALHRVYILNQNFKMQPIGLPGELCIAGPGLAEGYLNQPELTAEKFVNKPGNRETRLYRTGDLVRWLPDGNIEFLGRIDQQVKIRGFRIEPGEIESCLLNHPAVKEVVVIVIGGDDRSRQLAAYLVPSSSYRMLQNSISSELREYLSHKLPAYMVPAYFMVLSELPVTTSGKIDRRSLPLPSERLAVKGTDYVAPATETEKQLVSIWQEILKLELVGIEDDFFEIGGDSILAYRIIARIRTFGKGEVSLRCFFEKPTIKALSRRIDNKQDEITRIYRASNGRKIPRPFPLERLCPLQPLDKENKAYVPRVLGIKGDLVEVIKKGEYCRYSAPRPTEKKEYYALSSAQKRLFILHQMEHQNVSYNIPVVLTLAGYLETGKLDRALWKLTERHQSLRTSIHTINGEPFQKIAGKVSFEIHYFDEAAGAQSGRGKEDREAAARPIVKNFIRPFELSQAPLLRAGLIRFGVEEYVLMVDMHHIITDGTSLNIFVDDLLKLYCDEKLPPMSIQYIDYLEWKQKINGTFEGKERFKAQEVYWMKEFEGELPVLNIPLDFPRSAVQSFKGDRVVFPIPEPQTDELKKLSRETGATLYMLLLAIYVVFLSRICGQEDIIIGTVTEGRDLEEMSRVIGMFVKTLALRIRPVGEKKFSIFLRELKIEVLRAFENQDYPFEDLVKTVSLNRDASRNPLFDTIFVLQNPDILELEIPGLSVQHFDYQSEGSKFDLTLWGVETGTKLLFTFEYSLGLFKNTTVSRFVQYFRKIIGLVLEQPDQAISAMDWIPEKMKRQITLHFNNTAADYPVDKTVYELIQEQVKLNPGRVGVLYKEMHLTYRLLNRKANRLARALRRRQVVSGSIAAIQVKPSIEMIVGVLSVLKAGGAFLPVDSTTPEERVMYILLDSSTRLLLTHSRCETGPAGGIATMDLEPQRWREGAAENLERANKMTDPAYVIYTSGSTGRPKGVMVEHRSLVNLCGWHNLHYSISSSDRTVKYAGFGFDASIWEMFPYLIKGVCIDVIGDHILLDIGELNRYFEIHCITVGFLPTQVCEQFMNLENSSLRLLLTGGDKLKKYTARNYALINHYGPTENTVVTTSFKVRTGFANIPIGKPIFNTHTYILDRAGNLQPIGIAGELCISGDGLARGYLNRPELTAEKFIAHPLQRGERLYRTGDLSRLLPDGNIEFLGRKDRQVKIRGNRLELSELECHLERMAGIKQAVVLPVEEKSGENQFLCAYLVSDGELKTVGLREKLADTLPAYMIPSIFIQIEKVPLSANGKIKREALPVPVFESSRKFEAPAAGLEKTLTRIWADVLEIEETAIGVDDNFFELGGHSLKINILILKIQKRLKVKIPMARIFKSPTIRGLTHYLKERAINSEYKSIKRVEEKEYYALSSAQKRLFVLQQMDRNSTSYHISNAVIAEKKLDIDRLENVFRKLVKRHESLRTSFGILGKESFQRIHPEVRFSIRQYEEKLTAVKQILYEFIKPFDLRQAPLFRVCSIIVEDDRHILMLDMHHIISDAISFNLFISELRAFYDGKELPLLKLQYKDYSEWQSSEKKQESRLRQENFWKKQFEGDIPILSLPTDYPRPDCLDFEGDAVGFEIESDLTGRIKQYAVHSFVTLNIVFLSAYYVLLSKYSGQEDLVVGVPISGRTHNDFIKTLGFFSNMLALRNRPLPHLTFKEFLEEVKGNAINAYENQEAQFDELIWKLKVPRISGRHPLVETVLAMQEEMGEASEHKNHIGPLKFSNFEFQEKKSHFDLMLHISEGEGLLRMILEYRNSLFRRATIEEMGRCYVSILKQVIRNSNLKLLDISITDHFLRASSKIPAEKAMEFEFN